MAGLAAALNAAGIIEALTAALAPRGADGALSRLEGRRHTRLEVAMRAVMPAIPRVIGDPESDEARVIAAFAIDGIASVTALDAGYAAHGPPGLLDGEDPYAVILADAESDALVLARNGDGPGLYYARHADGWAVASEPIALVGAGIPGEPDVEVVQRFIGTGACDDTERTFFARIWRVLPDEVVVLTAGGGVDTHAAPRRRRVTAVEGALQTAVAGRRIGVLLGAGLPGAALLGTALARANRARPLPVHTMTYLGLDGPASHTPAVLVPMPHGVIRHTPHAVAPDGLDLDGFLADIGEPVPDLRLHSLWAVARDTEGDIDTLVDSSHGEPGCVARVSDRLSARYGVVVRCPLRGVEPMEGRSELESIVGRTLPPAAVRYAADDSAGTATAAELLLSIRASVTAALATPRPWTDRAAGVEGLRRLAEGEAVDADALLRAYLVERWLRMVDAGETDAEPPRPDVVVADTMWTRVPVRTDVLPPGEQVPARAAGYVSKALTEPSHAEALGGPWFAVVAGKVIAVGQRRVCPLWDIRPGWVARTLSSIARPRLPRLGDSWTMQVAMDDGGVGRVAAAVLAGMVRLEWAEWLLPDAAANLFPPRPDAVPPADGAVVRAPFRPDDAAHSFVDAMGELSPPEAVDTLVGCAVLSADERGSRLVGFAPGPYADAVVDAELVVAEICADNPFGQGQERTPIIIAIAPRHDS